jgi:hypothetical protein
VRQARLVIPQLHQDGVVVAEEHHGGDMGAWKRHNILGPARPGNTAARVLTH